ncbi:MAG: 2-oxo acid dehydrogenase subunit E2 [Armatimonadota bacterium]|nr:2-oxo acid dehydrogenase subunit E2 [Armatimonadota bacterium]
MVEVIMPKMGDAMEEGTLVEWLVKDGAAVKSGDIIGNIQTDKATVELTAPSSGTLSGLLINAGDSVPVGKPIAAILKEGEKLPDGWGGVNGAASPRNEEANQAVVAEPEEAAQKEAEASPAKKAIGGRVVASPLARRLAVEGGIEIESIVGSGPNGRIVERDIKAALEVRKPAETVEGTEDRFVPFTKLQRITAERTAHSKQTVPHYQVTVDVDVENLEELRTKMNAENPDHKVGINDFIVKASAMALADQPHVNASFDSSGQRREFGAINIGLAIAVPDGLTVGVLRDCKSKSLRQLADLSKDIVSRARDNKLSMDEVSGSTFAISNMGMFDVYEFNAIINEPNGAIIAVGRATPVPVAIDSDDGYELEVRHRMKVTGSFDHRIIDGAVGAAFLGALKRYLESPTLLLS